MIPQEHYSQHPGIAREHYIYIYSSISGDSYITPQLKNFPFPYRKRTIFNTWLGFHGFTARSNANAVVFYRHFFWSLDLQGKAAIGNILLHPSTLYCRQDLQITQMISQLFRATCILRGHLPVFCKKVPGKYHVLEIKPVGKVTL